MRSGMIAAVLAMWLGATDASRAQDQLESLLRPIPGESRRASSANPDLARNNDAKTIGPGETLVIGDLVGPGVITHFWCTVGSKDPFHGRSLVLRIYWDGAERPSVEAPLGDFFGVGHGAWSSFESIPAVTSSHGRSRNCFWKMPFKSHAKVTVTNESTEFGGATFYYYLDWRKVPALPEDVLYFHARYGQEHPAKTGDYTILNTKGKGHYVGTVLSVLHTQIGWFGEGDDRFYIDGDPAPTLRGTGTEDYFGDAWGFREFSSPYLGVSLWEGNITGDRGTAYRWHLPDPISFTQSLMMTIEHKGSRFTSAGIPIANFEERPDWLSSVAYWYQTPVANWEEPLAPLEKRLPPYQLLPIKSLKVRAEPKIVLLQQEGGLSYIPRKSDASLEIDFEVSEAGAYRIAAIMGEGMLYSRYQPLLDGKEIGPIRDFGADGMDTHWVNFDSHELEKGKHTLRFEGRGHSARRRPLAPEYFGLSVQSLILFPLNKIAP